MTTTTPPTLPNVGLPTTRHDPDGTITFVFASGNTVGPIPTVDPNTILPALLATWRDQSLTDAAEYDTVRKILDGTI